MAENVSTELKEVPEDKVEAEARRDSMFSALEMELDKELGKAIADKSPVEARMLADESQYWGTVGGWDKEDVASGHDQTGRSRRGMPTDNKTRSKTRIAASRIGDMLFPTNSPNWDMRPSAYPDIDVDDVLEEYKRQQAAKAPPPPPPPAGQELMGAMPPDQMGGGPEAMPAPMAPEGPQAPPPEPPDYDKLATEIATKRCRKMRQFIRDALGESDYSKLGRAVIMDGSKVGTGIVKGPFVRYTTKRSYSQEQDDEGEVTVLKVEKIVQPAVSRVSPWNFFPQRARCIEEAEHAFELHVLNRVQLAKMVDSHGFFSRQTAKLLSKKPSLGTVESILAQRAAITNYSMNRYENSYAVWEYHGIIDVKVLREMGFEIPEDPENNMDELANHYGTVWFSEGCILRIDMSPIDAMSSLPYRVWCYEEDETHIFGFGVPFIMRDDQYVIDMVWSSILHNTSVSAGPQLAVEKGCMTPADGSYDIRGPKLWYKNDVDIPITQAMEAFVIPNTLANTMPVYQQAIQNADDNTMLPLMLGTGAAKGQEGGASGMTNVSMMNQTNIVQRQAAHNWDDNITDPLITGFYQWFMESDDPKHEEAKGDYTTEVRGASHLLVKDTQAQHVQLLMQMAASDPELRASLHMNDVYRLYLSFLDVPVDNLVKTPEEIEAEMAAQPPDPVQEAELALKQSQTKAADAKAQADLSRVEVDKIRAQTALLEAQNGQKLEMVDHSEIMALELRYAEMRDKQNDRDLQLQLKLLDRETKLMEVAAKNNLEYSKMEAQISSDRERMLADLSITKGQQASKDYFDSARLRLDQYSEELRTKNMDRGFDSFG